MPRFFFRLVERHEVYFYSDGQDMADEDTARKEAAIALTEVARDVVAVTPILEAHELPHQEDGAPRSCTLI
jgi:hypothetical protein